MAGQAVGSCSKLSDAGKVKHIGRVKHVCTLYTKSDGKQAVKWVKMKFK